MTTGGTEAVPGFDPDHFYYGLDGEKIDVLTWGRLREDQAARTIGHDDVILPGNRPATLITVWLGMVEPYIYDARLYGSAYLIGGEVQQIEVYDSKADAIKGHREHLNAIADHFHCARCRSHVEHID